MEYVAAPERLAPALPGRLPATAPARLRGWMPTAVCAAAGADCRTAPHSRGSTHIGMSKGWKCRRPRQAVRAPVCGFMRNPPGISSLGMLVRDGAENTREMRPAASAKRGNRTTPVLGRPGACCSGSGPPSGQAVDTAPQGARLPLHHEEVDGLQIEQLPLHARPLYVWRDPNMPVNLILHHRAWPATPITSGKQLTHSSVVPERPQAVPRASVLGTPFAKPCPTAPRQRHAAP